jgi:hypothetical protein
MHEATKLISETTPLSLAGIQTVDRHAHCGTMTSALYSMLCYFRIHLVARQRICYGVRSNICLRKYSLQNVVVEQPLLHSRVDIEATV